MAGLKTGDDDDPMGPPFENAVCEQDSSGLAALVAYYRAKWAEARGRLAEIERVIAAKDEILRAKDEMICWLMPSPISRMDADDSGEDREGPTP